MPWRGPVVGSCVALLAFPALASAADEPGRDIRAGGAVTRIVLSQPERQSLRAHGLRLTASGPARASGGELRMPVTGGTVAASTVVRNAGGLVVRGRGKDAGRLTLTDIMLTLGGRPRISALVSGQRRAVFRLALAGGGLKLDRAAKRVRLTRVRVRTTSTGAALIARRLRLDAPPPRRFGRLTVDAVLGDALGQSGGPAANGSPPGVPASSELPRLARPASATGVTAASVTWHVRESFIRYINTGEGTSVSDGATAGPPTADPPGSAPLVYSFRFQFREGWRDAASGKAAVYFGGAVRFRYAAHGIDLTARDPEIELNGASSRAIFRFGDAQGKRGVLVNLDLAKAGSITGDPGGKTFTYTEVPGLIPEGTASSVFAGFYLPGDPFGWFSVELSIP